MRIKREVGNSPLRKPVRKETAYIRDCGKGRVLTPELIAQANREAREWRKWAI